MLYLGHELEKSMSLVSASIIMRVALSKVFFLTWLDEVPKDNHRLLSSTAQSFYVEYTLSSTKNGPQDQCLCILELVFNPQLKLFSNIDVKKTLSSILHEKAAATWRVWGRFCFVRLAIWCLFVLNFGYSLEDSWIYIHTNNSCIMKLVCAVWTEPRWTLGWPIKYSFHPWTPSCYPIASTYIWAI